MAKILSKFILQYISVQPETKKQINAFTPLTALKAYKLVFLEHIHKYYSLNKRVSSLKKLPESVNYFRDPFSRVYFDHKIIEDKDQIIKRISHTARLDSHQIIKKLKVEFIDITEILNVINSIELVKRMHNLDKIP